jgi:PIN domain nuclease of toxin-antitoxin system
LSRTRKRPALSCAAAVSTEDPADRFLAATAKVYDLTIVTADERLLALREINVLSNRSR